MTLNAVPCIQVLLQEVPQTFRSLTHAEALEPLAPGKWSRLQILGHLCDSAINNVSRFIRISYEPQPLVVFAYEQNHWVDAQRYNQASVEEVLSLWISLNQSILRVISDLKPAQLSLSCKLPNGDNVTLQWLVEDYLNHIVHHLKQIFPDIDFL
ncbi:DinB family protein [Paenibacillus sp. GCM10012306]|uniref:DinB family protein n=1 Tax=Paenibacillus sp. GCM10012306 TaxID=3317342 RepID=UPI00360F33DA